MTGPLAYLITFRTYGTWLHGEERGSVDRNNRARGEVLIAPNKARLVSEEARLKSLPFTLNAEQRAIVDKTIRTVCDYKKWSISELNVRTNHIHVVVTPDCAPELAMNTLKSWSTRRLVEEGTVEKGFKPWARHGSTKYLWKPESVVAACHYVREGQGGELPLHDFE